MVTIKKFALIFRVGKIVKMKSSKSISKDITSKYEFFNYISLKLDFA